MKIRFQTYMTHIWKWQTLNCILIHHYFWNWSAINHFLEPHSSKISWANPANVFCHVGPLYKIRTWRPFDTCLKTSWAICFIQLELTLENTFKWSLKLRWYWEIVLCWALVGLEPSLGFFPCMAKGETNAQQCAFPVKPRYFLRIEM